MRSTTSPDGILCPVGPIGQFCNSPQSLEIGIPSSGLGQAVQGVVLGVVAVPGECLPRFGESVKQRPDAGEGEPARARVTFWGLRA